MLGFSYAWGSETKPQDIDLDPGDDDTVFDPDDDVNVVYRRLTFMIGFSIKI
jgi:hypothetical protein